MNNFCDGYHLDLSAVIGIGPLKILTASDDPAVRLMYSPMIYSFELFFPNYKIEVKSEVRNTKGIETEKLTANFAYFDLFKVDYLRVKQMILFKKKE